MTTTEQVLRDWRFGSTQAERLTAALLDLEGYVDIDPQHPLGGPDGKKDVVCFRGRRKHIAAVYFPATSVTEPDIQRKFTGDFEGVKRNNAEGFCFFVNQHLTLTQRQNLLDLADPDTIVEIYHLERMRTILDSAQGCGIRLEYLKIPMSTEEQLAFLGSVRPHIADQLARIETLQKATLAQLMMGTETILQRTAAISLDLQQALSSTLDPSSWAVPFSGSPTSRLDVPMICWMHRIAVKLPSHPESARGVLRQISVTIGGADGEHVFTPMGPGEIPAALGEWASSWRDSYEELLNSERDVKINALTEFYYQFLAIHPFLDGNGRMAFILLDQAAREVAHRPVSHSLITERAPYFEALNAANDGDITLLRNRIDSALK